MVCPVPVCFVCFCLSSSVSCSWFSRSFVFLFAFCACFLVCLVVCLCVRLSSALPFFSVWGASRVSFGFSPLFFFWCGLGSPFGLALARSASRCPSASARPSLCFVSLCRVAFCPPPVVRLVARLPALASASAVALCPSAPFLRSPVCRLALFAACFPLRFRLCRFCPSPPLASRPARLVSPARLGAPRKEKDPRAYGAGEEKRRRRCAPLFAGHRKSSRYAYAPLG